jgi:predicted Zn-dependent protease
MARALAEIAQIPGAPAGNVPARLVFISTGFGVGLPIGNRERCMNRFAIRILTLAIFTMALVAAPVVTRAYAAPDNDPPPPSSDKGKKKKSSEVRPGTENSAFAKSYRAAYATIYDRNDYAAAIAQLKALGHDDSAAVANLIGYSHRKLGDYKVSQIWYERALKADPNHVKTWQYYGLWQVEQGNRDSAQYHLNRIAALAGTDSEEYRSLAAALEKPPGTGLVY